MNQNARTASAQRPLRILALLSDGYGTVGGMAEFNRRLLEAIVTSGRARGVTALDMDGGAEVYEPPPGVERVPLPRGDKGAYALRALRQAGRGPFDLVISGHVNLTPLALAAARLARARLWTLTHGIEIWTPPPPLRRLAFERSDRVLTVSYFSKRRMLQWSRLPAEKVQILHNTVDPEAFAIGERPRYLEERYGLGGKRVFVTVARLSAAEQRKGHDRVIAALPRVAEAVPDAVYVVVGDGDDRPRLERLARECGVTDRVVFAGLVPQGELADHYRLAELLVMPSRGDGFGIVFLEAACCGVPSVASSDDAGGEIVPQLGGAAVPSGDGVKLGQAIVEGLERSTPDPAVRETAIALFGPERFRARVTELLDSA